MRRAATIALAAALLACAAGCTLSHATRAERDAAPARDADAAGLDVAPRDATADGADGGLDAVDEAADFDAADAVDAPDARPDAPVCMASSPSNYCMEVRRLPQPPVIDGVLDCGLRLQPVPTTEWTGTDPLPPGHSAQFAIAYRDDGLYVFVAVVDPRLDPVASADLLYCGDGVEVYVDDDGVYPNSPAYDETGTRQMDFAFLTADGAVTATASYRDARAITPNVPASRHRLVTTATGYALELFVTAEDLGMGTWMPSGHIGFDLGINVGQPPTRIGGGTCDSRAGQYFLRLAGGGGDRISRAPFSTVEAFCLVATR